MKKKPKTRNIMLMVACGFVIIYTLVDMVLGFVSIDAGYIYQLDSTLTSEVFGFAKWVVASGAGITVAKTVKGETNSDETEDVFNREDAEDCTGPEENSNDEGAG